MTHSRLKVSAWMMAVLGLSILAGLCLGVIIGGWLHTAPAMHQHVFRGAALPHLTEIVIQQLRPGEYHPGLWIFQTPWLILVAYTAWHWPSLLAEPWRFCAAWIVCTLLEASIAGIITLALLLPWFEIFTMLHLETHVSAGGILVFLANVFLLLFAALGLLRPILPAPKIKH